MTRITISPLPPCTKCGNRCDYNTPTAPASNINGPILCNPCSDNTPILRRGLEQRLYDGSRHWHHGYRTYNYHNIVVHCKDDTDEITHAWYDNGRMTIPFDAMRGLFEDQPLTLQERFEILWALWQAGIVFCTICHEPFTRRHGTRYPFAGIACRSCLMKHRKAIHESWHMIGD